MATVRYVGLQRRRAQVGTLTVTAADTGGTIVVTVGGTKSVTVTPTTTNTTTTATELAAACAASPEGEFREITWASLANVVTFTGPADGTPVTVSKAVTGTNAVTLVSAATAALSPNDLGDGANYDIAALPSAADDLVFENGPADVKWNLTALAGIALATVTRRRSYTGRLGLPAVNARGYPEYRGQEVKLDAPTIIVEQPGTDQAGHARLWVARGGSACTLTVTGEGFGSQLGSEALEVRGLEASSIVRVTDASVAIAPLAGQTAVVPTVLGTNSTVRIGAGASTLTAVTLLNCTARIGATYTVLTVNGNGSRVEVVGTAAGTTTVVQKGGTITWLSSGTPGTAPIVGTGGTLDFTQAPTPVTVSGTAEVYGGGRWLDGGRVAGTYSLKLTRTDVPEIGIELGPNRTIAIT